MAESSATVAAAEVGAKKPFSKAKIFAIIGAIVLLQCVLAYLYLPTGDAGAKGEGKTDAAAAHVAEKTEKEPAAADSRGDRREVDLGKFSLTAFDPNSNTTLLIDFHLFGTVAADHDEKDGKAGEHGGHGGHGGKGGEGSEDDNTAFGKGPRRLSLPDLEKGRADAAIG